MAAFSPGVVEKSPEAVGEQPPWDNLPPWVLRKAIFLGRRHANAVQGVPDIRAVAEAVQGVGVPPGSLRLRQFRYGTLPALARPRRVFPADEAKYIPMKPCPG